MGSGAWRAKTVRRGSEQRNGCSLLLFVEWEKRETKSETKKTREKRKANCAFFDDVVCSGLIAYLVS